MNYAVLTPLRGYRRADGLREPIGAGEVVRLPLDKATDALLGFGAIEPTDAEETCPIKHVSVFGQSFGQVADALSPPTPIAVVAVTDRYALIGAIEELGGMVFFVGEGLPDDAENILPDFSNEQMLDELSLRLHEGRLSPTLLSGMVEVVDEPAGVVDATLTGAVAVEGAPGAGTTPATIEPVADTKTARKPKAAAK